MKTILMTRVYMNDRVMYIYLYGNQSEVYCVPTCNDGVHLDVTRARFIEKKFKVKTRTLHGDNCNCDIVFAQHENVKPKKYIGCYLLNQ